ncbi:transcriptional regulator with XRE-family HTH domain [Spinactinospora alkalitolerans]|uniref:Transcriptional regulator with XRE-family HTH domain n=1 Tax=Spinactinospora alkalitolerans TaxID=687207 RepID=A0A852TPD1_9ACTN|nr:helix-turn-helix transcriptional regulator [Spinactinospora alkalitolerans]NYE45147.1 transcriptional regulator with XRE-family HTH domain [Spinactinospora alkalitolerans]
MADRLSPTLRRRRLSAELKRLREESNLTAEQVGEHLGWSRGRLTNMELNKWKRPDPVIVRALATLYKASEETTEALVTLAKQSRAKGWWTKFEDVFTDAYVGFEAEASVISTYQTMVVPGLLQTPEYATASDRAVHLRNTSATERAVAARMERQEILDREDAPKLWAVIDEAVLLRPAGGKDVMRAQIEKLICLSEEVNTVKIQVLPLERGLHPGITGSFTLLDFPNPADKPIAYFETRTDGIYQEDPTMVEIYREAWDDIRVMADHPEASTTRMAELIKRYE